MQVRVARRRARKDAEKTKTLYERAFIYDWIFFE
jgi:hypothetical protein